MSILCLTGHAAVPGPFRNQGLRFGTCRRCGCDMIRAKAGWQTIPPGFRLVWRAPNDPAAADSTRLPPGLATTAPRRPRRRAMPWQGVATDLAAAGLHLLGWTLATRWRHWRRTLSAPASTSAPMLRLQRHG